MLPNQILSVSLIQTCPLPSFPLFWGLFLGFFCFFNFSETVKLAVVIQNPIPKGKGWEEEKLPIFIEFSSVR